MDLRETDELLLIVAQASLNSAGLCLWRNSDPKTPGRRNSGTNHSSLAGNRRQLARAPSAMGPTLGPARKPGRPGRLRARTCGHNALAGAREAAASNLQPPMCGGPWPYKGASSMRSPPMRGQSHHWDPMAHHEHRRARPPRATAAAWNAPEWQRGPTSTPATSRHVSMARAIAARLRTHLGV